TLKRAARGRHTRRSPQRVGDAVLCRCDSRHRLAAAQRLQGLVDCPRSMKVSLLCGAHYAGAEAHLQRPPVSPTMCDPQIAQYSFDQWLEYAGLADDMGFDWISVSE